MLKPEIIARLTNLISSNHHTFLLNKDIFQINANLLDMYFVVLQLVQSSESGPIAAQAYQNYKVNKKTKNNGKSLQISVSLS